MDPSPPTPSLNLLSSKRLPHPIKFPLTAYSHKHDLLAIVSSGASQSQSQEVQIFRIVSGQQAFAVKRPESEIEVTALSWKDDGTCLGIGWSDGKSGIYDGGTGRLISLMEFTAGERDGEEEEEAVVKAGCLGFVGHSTGERDRAKVMERVGGREVTTEEWYDGIAGDERDDGEEDGHGRVADESSTADLPRAIAALDVTTVLPRLSAVQVHGYQFPKSGPGASKFGSQAATDVQFETQKPSTSGMVRSLLVCQDDGTAKVLLDETVIIGMRNIAGKPLMHAGNGSSSVHAVLCEGETEDSSLRMTFIDLPLSTLNGPLLHVITTNTKRIQTLTDYIWQTTACMQHDFTSNVLIPSRFLNLLAEDLQSKEEHFPDVVANLYHLAMAGNSGQGVLLEWLVDFLKDANIRRWEQHLNTMYSSVQTHLFINLLPALDRFSIALTTLRGQATFHEGTGHSDCKPQLFTGLLDNIDNIRLLAQRLLLIVQTEHREFRAFIRWLKLQIEIAVAEPFSQSALETEDREVPSIDYPLVLNYIKNGMMKSKLAQYLQNRPSAAERRASATDVFLDGVHIRDVDYDRMKNALGPVDNPQGERRMLPSRRELIDNLTNLPVLTQELVVKVGDLLKNITAWQQEVVFSPIDPPSIELALPVTHQVLDMSMTPLLARPGCSTKILAVDPTTRSQLAFLEVSPTQTPSSSPQAGFKSPGQDSTTFPFDADILDAKLCPHSSHPNALVLLGPNDEDSSVRLVRHDLQTNESETLHSFAQDSSFRPAKLLVGGRRGKLVVVVFGSGGREWRVLDLDGGTVRPKRGDGGSKEKDKGKGKGVLWQDEDEEDDSDEGMDVA